MSCDLEHIEAFAYGELSTSEARAVEHHVRVCAGCRSELATLREERRAIRSRPSAGISTAVRRAFDRRFEAAQKKRSRSEIFQLWGSAAGFALGLAVVLGLGRPSPSRIETQWAEPGLVCESPASGGELFVSMPCGDSDLVAQVEARFEACLMASPHLVGPDACL